MGVTIPIVNVMAMDYYQGDIEMGNAAISAAENTLSQMKAVNGSYTYANVGITPMIGVNDDGSTFTLADASSVASWASSNGIGRLAFWSVDRDQACPGGNGGAASPTCSGVSREHRPVHQCVHRSRERRRNTPASRRGTLRRYGGRHSRHGAGGQL